VCPPLQRNRSTQQPMEMVMPDWLNSQVLTAYALSVGTKVLGALVLWFIGGVVINFVVKMSNSAMNSRKIDLMLIKYVDSSLRVVLRIVLVIAILSIFGIETTSFAALIAAVGLAIGVAWSGLLSNFAAGVFLVLLRPFKVGDMITAGGATGDVEEVGLFVTTLKTADNLRVYVGNNKIFTDNIVNYTHNPYRRVDLKCQLAHTVDPREAMAKLKTRLSQIPNVVATPAPDVEILEFNPAGTLLGVRPYCSNNNYWQVFFDTNKAILEVGASNVWPVPAPHQVLLQKQG
jgi:small conductance mechanosensitive channel